MTTKLEHANLCVRDIDAMLGFLRAAFPEFRVPADAILDDQGRRPNSLIIG